MTRETRPGFVAAMCDHKVVAKQFLWTGLFFLFVGGALAMLMRFQLAYPGRAVPLVGELLFARSGGVISPPAYTELFTMHGLVMIFWAVTPILIGALGHFCVPLLVGARGMAFPVLCALSYWTFVASGIVLGLSFTSKLGTASAGWTAYPPLSTNVGAPGAGQTLVTIALVLASISTVMEAINIIVTVLRRRAPGMAYTKMPLTVWGLLLTSILNVLFVPVVAAAALLLLSDRLLGTHWFIAGAVGGAAGGDPVSYQHLFWIFGHPEVYVLILPVWGMVGDLLSFFARKPAHGYRRSVYAMSAITALSALVYGHHMFFVGLTPLFGLPFEVLTLAISVPSMVLAINWLRTLHQGSIRRTTPMLFALGMVFVFGAGGLSGLLLGAISTDMYLHDTMYVVGHFHLTMAAASLLGAFAGLYFWFPKMFGRMMSERLGKVHFVGTLVLSFGVFGTMMIAGWAGQHRRLYDPYQYAYLAHLVKLNRATSHMAFTLGLFQLVFVVNALYSLFFFGKKAEKNPWQAPTLEWTHASSPPVRHNFDVALEVLRGPHELGDVRAKALLGRDYLDQVEPLPDEAQGAGGAG